MADYFFDISTDAKLKTDVADFINVPGTLGVDYWKPAERAAREQYINELISEEFATELLALAAPTTKQQAVIDKIRGALAQLTLIKMLPKLNIKIQRSGIGQDNVQDQNAAPWWAIRDLKRSFQVDASIAVDSLLKFLEKNAADYPTYKTSAQATQNQKNFVNTVETASLYIPIITSHFVLTQMRPAMSRVDESILRLTLTPQLYNFLMDFVKAGTAWGAYEPLRKHIEAAEIHFAFAQSIPLSSLNYNEDFKLHVPLISEAETGRQATKVSQDEKQQIISASKKNGADAINQLKKELALNAIDYPEYIIPETPQEHFIKTDTGTIYAALGVPPRK